MTANPLVDSIQGMILLDPEHKLLNIDLDQKAQIPLHSGTVKEVDVFSTMEAIEAKLPFKVVFLHNTPENTSGDTDIAMLTKDNVNEWILGVSDWKFENGKKVG